MGARGPAPTPTAILEMRGSWRAKQNTDEPVPDVLCKEFMPSSLDDQEQATYREIAEHLINLRVLTVLDWRLLERYVQLYHRLQRALQREDTKHTEIDSLSSQLLRIEQQLGMTPAARSRITSTPKQEQRQDAGAAKYFRKETG